MSTVLKQTQSYSLQPAGVARPSILPVRTTTQTVFGHVAETAAQDTFANANSAKPPEQPLVTPDGYFNPDAITYSPEAIYSKTGALTLGQKICDFLIRKVYQKPTRSSVYKWLGNPCPFKNKAGKLSCSEYTLVMIHRYGVIKGIALGTWRILKCNPLTVIKGHYADPKLKDACC
jgi:putative component of membrane protein insertase Oxa1/YidC/SpoIIIJ protein YidD